MLVLNARDICSGIVTVTTLPIFSVISTVYQVPLMTSAARILHLCDDQSRHCGLIFDFR